MLIHVLYMLKMFIRNYPIYTTTFVNIETADIRFINHLLIFTDMPSYHVVCVVNLKSSTLVQHM